MSSPGMSSPRMRNPGMSSPGMSSPRMSSPGMSSPGISSPEMSSPEMSLGGAEERGKRREEGRGGRRKGKEAVGGPGRQCPYPRTRPAGEDLPALPLPKF